MDCIKHFWSVFDGFAIENLQRFTKEALTRSIFVVEFFFLNVPESHQKLIGTIIRVHSPASNIDKDP